MIESKVSKCIIDVLFQEFKWGVNARIKNNYLAGNLEEARNLQILHCILDGSHRWN